MDRMGRSVGALFSVALFICLLEGGQTWAARQPSSCPACHKNLRSALPQGHSSVSDRDISVCLTCHGPKNPEQPEFNPFGARIHRAHIRSQPKVDCQICHTWVPGKSFGLFKQKGSWGNPSKTAMDLIRQTSYSWSNSSFLDSLHGKKNITCGGCHGKRLPSKDDTVDNDRCLSCHGSYEKLAEKTASVEFPKRNPHKSHLVALACTKCHKAHSVSRVYCLECHQGFQMKITGGSQPANI
jgi:fumarate reductase flavoprotein subunit